jgi:hypothetical protein
VNAAARAAVTFGPVRVINGLSVLEIHSATEGQSPDLRYHLREKIDLLFRFSQTS